MATPKTIASRYGLSVLESSDSQPTSTKASRNPPTTAAGRLPSPPMTQAMKPFSIGLEAGAGHHVGHDGEEEQPGDAGEHAGDEERPDHDGIGADAHQARGLEIVRGGAERQPEDRAPQEDRQSDNDDDGGEERHEIESLDSRAPDRKRRVHEGRKRYPFRTRPEDQQEQPLQRDGDGERGHQQRQRLRPAEAPVGQALQQQGGERGGEDRGGERDQPAEAGAEQDVKRVAGDRDQFAMREIGQPQDAEDDGDAERHERVDRTERQRVDDLLDREAHSRGPDAEIGLLEIARRRARSPGRRDSRLPLASTYPRSAIFSARSTFCSTSRIVTPLCRSSSMISNTRATTIGARPSDGSSISSRRGRLRSARAIATCCCSPPDSRPACSSRALPDRPGTGRVLGGRRARTDLRAAPRRQGAGSRAPSCSETAGAPRARARSRRARSLPWAAR